jgi:hypothetical protein
MPESPVQNVFPVFSTGVYYRRRIDAYASGVFIIADAQDAIRRG